MSRHEQHHDFWLKEGRKAVCSKAWCTRLVKHPALHLQAIKKHEDSHKQYRAKLLKEGNIKEDQLDAIDKNVQNILQKAFEEAKVLCVPDCPYCMLLMPLGLKCTCTGMFTL